MGMNNPGMRAGETGVSDYPPDAGTPVCATDQPDCASLSSAAPVTRVIRQSGITVAPSDW